MIFIYLSDENSVKLNYQNKNGIKILTRILTACVNRAHTSVTISLLLGIIWLLF